MIDPHKANYALYSNISPDVPKVNCMCPEEMFKTVKNPVEIENIKKAQVKDSVAHIRFMKCLRRMLGRQESLKSVHLTN